jgi:signal transduction histidine kinase
MKLLLAEDNPADVRIVREMLREAPGNGFQLEHVGRLDAALDRLRREPFDEVLLDLGLPDSQGMQTLRDAQNTNHALPIVVLTGLADERFAEEAVRAGAQDYLIKGQFGSELLVRTIRYAIERKRAEAELARSNAEIRRLNLELEQRVVERTAELETANKELESFSYSVSHDLRAPLRSIDGFSRIVLRDCAEKIDEANRNNLQRIREASQRMGELIDDLLRLSRTSRADLHRVPLDLTAIAHHIIEELQQTEPEREVTWQVAPELRVNGDAVLLRAALENLLGNAWKFTGRQAHPKIEFGITPDAERVFFVRDNGAGFDMAYADKLFGAFQRLHSTTEFPGTGIGLATVQRIVRRHGGRIWAEAAVDQGATFYFTIGPAANPP